MREHVVHLEKKSLKRILGVSDLFAVGYGDIGSSIFYALGATALYALGATPIALAIAGFVFICTALTYAEMATTFPEPGGSASYARHAFNDLVSFIAGWGLLLDYIVTIAISAFAIPPYLSPILEQFGMAPEVVASTVPRLVISISLIAFLLVLNIVGVKYSTRLSWILAAFTIVTQVLLIVFAAIFLINIPAIVSHLKIGVQGVDWSPSWPEFLKGTAMAMVAYTGIEAITQLAAEAKQPSIVIPKAIHRVMALLVALYLGISFAGLSVMSPQTLGTTYLQDPVVGIVLHFPYVGAFLAPWIGLLAAILLLIASNAGLIGCSRLTFAMGEYYQVPYFFHRLHRRFRTPYVSLAVFAALAALLVIVSRGEMLFLADMYNFGAMIAFFFAHISLLTLRIRKPDLTRPYRAPFNIPLGKGRTLSVTALIGAIATLAVWLVVIVTKVQGRNIGCLWLLCGVVMYVLYRRRKKLSPASHLFVEKIKIPEYKPMSLKKILVTARADDKSEAMQIACQLAKLHHASVMAIAVIEVPPAMPISQPDQAREEVAQLLLKRAEAIAREHHVAMEFDIVRARSLIQAILNFASQEHFDLIIIGSAREELGPIGTRTEKLLSKAPCRIWFCKC